jgi:exopolysaccharide biosynthesis protein
METTAKSLKQRLPAAAKCFFVVVICAVSLAVSAFLLMDIFLNNSDPGKKGNATAMDYAMMDRYDMSMTNITASSLDGILSLKKVYWLSDADQVAPEPNPSKFGETDDPSTLQWLLDEAQELLDGQTTYFTTETEILPNTKVMYYLDDTIFVITWKQKINRVCYTISEVKIAHPSQFRRFLAGGEYGSSIRLTTTEMAASVNAVVASAGDFYKYRRAGTIVYDGKLQRMEGTRLDVCFVDDLGNLHLKSADELTTEDEVNSFIAENNIRFSLAFGPILIRDGVRCEPRRYPLGEITKYFSRAGFGQRGELHYILTTANRQFFYISPTIREFAEAAEGFGCDQFYNLDGGQTATIAMNDQLFNAVDYGNQRQISDIIYFATAIPEEG